MKRMLYGFVASLALIAASQAWADGQAVYTQNCSGCHDNLAPKTGDKAAWAPLIKKGNDALVASVVSGKGAMPPRPGNASDADIKAAVGYIVSKSQ
jgi:cytochrome c5